MKKIPFGDVNPDSTDWMEQYWDEREREQRAWLEKFKLKVIQLQPGTLEFDDMKWLDENREKIMRMKKVIDLMV